MKRLIREFLNSVLIVQGIFSACLGLKGFLLSSNFTDGSDGLDRILQTVLQKIGRASI